MRLRQLARKLEVNPDKIVNLLTESGHSLTNEANGKLTAEQVVIVETHFGNTDELNEPLEEVKEEITDTEVTTEIVEETPAEIEIPLGPPTDVTSQVSEAIEPVEETTTQPEPTGRIFKAIEDEEEDPNVELIKAPKIELEGLKVVGKIELPEPKPKKEKSDPELEKTDKDKRQRNRRPDNRSPRSRNNKGRKHKNPVEEERKRQERIAARKKRDREAALKKKKEEHYKRKLKSQPAKRKVAKTIKPQEEVKREAPVIYQTKAEPKAPKQQGALRRFWGWLNGEYDKY